MAKEKKSKKCRSSRKILWWFFGTANLGAKCLAALALVGIAIKISPIKYQAKSFNECITERMNTGQNISNAVRFCNGGN